VTYSGMARSFFLVPYYVGIPVCLEDLEDAAAFRDVDNSTVAL